LPRKHIPLTAIRELDEACAGDRVARSLSAIR